MKHEYQQCGGGGIVEKVFYERSSQYGKEFLCMTTMEGSASAIGLQNQRCDVTTHSNNEGMKEGS